MDGANKLFGASKCPRCRLPSFVKSGCPYLWTQRTMLNRAMSVYRIAALSLGMTCSASSCIERRPSASSFQSMQA
jgi:hypothetical protein